MTFSFVSGLVFRREGTDGRKESLLGDETSDVFYGSTRGNLAGISVHKGQSRCRRVPISV